MEKAEAVAGLTALADETRLSILAALMRAGETGLSAGEIADNVDKPPSSLSGPLRHLRLSGLVARRKRGKLTVWAAPGALHELSRFISDLEKQADTAGRLTLKPIPQGSTEYLGMTATLAKNNLPTDDLGDDGQRYFALADAGGTEFGFGGIEGAGADQLLRSLIIYPPMRGKGAGRSLVRLLEARAREEGAQRLWLLTQDAERFFARLRYKTLARDKAPKTIQRTKQFAKLCPATAKLMAKLLVG